MTVEQFVASIIPGCERGFGNCATMGFKDASGNIEAGFVYHNWHPESGVIEISAGSLHRGWTTRDRIRAVFEYPFSQLGCRLVVARTSEDNRAVRRIMKALGAKEYAIPELRGPGEPEIILVLSSDAWRNSKIMR